MRSLLHEPMSAGAEATIPVVANPGRERISAAMARFVAEPASARPLATMRIGLAAVLLLQVAFIAPHLFIFFGSRGIVQAPIANAIVPPTLPRVTYLAELLAPLVHDERIVLLGSFGLYLVALHLLLVGWKTRVVASAAWLRNWA